ncbi:MAG: response regulator [Nitrospiria bacterium]
MAEPLKKNILIVDDELGVLKALDILLREKYDLVLAETGEEALGHFKSGKNFNLIILDYRLPDMDGIALLRKIRKQDRVTPILFISAYATKETLAEMLEVRAHGFIDKPWDNEQLEAKIARLVGKNPFELIHEKLNIPLQSLSIKIYRAVQYIERHHSSNNLSLEGVGGAVSLHPKYLSASFKEECGVGFHDYLIEIRIFRATELLKDPRRIIKQVSSEVGFADQGYFCKVFQNKIGLPPSAYRKELLSKKR